MKNMFFSTFLIILFVFINLSFAQITPQFTHLQEYLFDPCTTGVGPIGVGAWNVRHLPGALGDSVSMVDIEQGWNLQHEDLPAGIQLIYGDMNENETDHGTAVLGILVGQDNEFGICGICPMSTVSVSSRYLEGGGTLDQHDQAISAAISAATTCLDYGDILILEVEVEVILDKIILPAEYLPLTRAKIVTAIQHGIIVVEAAGNGGDCIDDSLNYPNFDSGAILVAAGQRNSLMATSTTNWGNRVDLHAWGDSVVTTGYGYLYSGGNPPNDYYTGSFNGTSSATAIVAGVVACLQGIYYANTGEKLSPYQMRIILRDSGYPCNPGEQIGNRPNLPAAINYIDADNQNYPNFSLANFVVVHTDQKDTSNQSFGHIKHYKPDLSQYTEHDVPHDFYFQEGTGQVIKALQELRPGSIEKYNEWVNLNILNHVCFTVTIPPPTYRAQFREVVPARIESNFISLNGIDPELDSIEFKDPWLIDFNDPPYGLRNQGMDAYFKLYVTPLNLTTAVPFKGVFKNQSGPPLWDPPYYSVRAPNPQVIPFHGQDID